MVLAQSSTCSALDLIRFANERLPRYMAVRDIKIVHELPKTASGKVLRKTLRESVAEEYVRTSPHANSIEQ